MKMIFASLPLIVCVILYVNASKAPKKGFLPPRHSQTIYGRSQPKQPKQPKPTTSGTQQTAPDSYRGIVGKPGSSTRTQLDMDVQSKYRCSPLSDEDDQGPLPVTVKDIHNPQVIASVPEHAERDLVYEHPDYPEINRWGRIPPVADTLPSTNMYVYRYLSFMQDKQERVDMVRLPYRYQIGFRLECKVYNESGLEFFVLENFLGSQLVRINILTQEVNGVRREFVHLPYIDRRDQASIIVKQTWILKTFREPDDYTPDYNFLQVTEEQDQNNQIPMNAYESQLHFKAKLQETTSIKVCEDVEVEFAVDWPASYCLKLMKTSRWVVYEYCMQSEWKVHGLWAGTKGYHSALNEANIPLLVPGVDHPNTQEFYNIWLRVSVATDIRSQLARAWLKHGRFLYTKAIDFFNAVVDINQRVNANELFQGVLKPSDTEFDTLHTITGAMEYYYRYRVQFICKQMSGLVRILYEIRFCFQRIAGKYQKKDCPENNSCKSPVILPKTPNPIPYLTLTIYWPPTQIGRLQTFRRKHDHNEPLPINQEYALFPPSMWMARGLCSSKQYAFLEQQYLTAMQYLLEDYPWLYLQHEYKDVMPQLTEEGHFGFSIYTHCGIYLRLLREIPGVKRYFNITATLFETLNTNLWPPSGQSERGHPDLLSSVPKEDWPEELMQPQVPQFNMEEDLIIDYVQEAIEAVVGKRVLLECIRRPIPIDKDQDQDQDQGQRPTRQELLKVIICYTPQFALIDCPKSVKFREKQYLYGPVAHENKRCLGEIVVIAKGTTP